jgi:hypothetical protein
MSPDICGCRAMERRQLAFLIPMGALAQPPAYKRAPKSPNLAHVIGRATRDAWPSTAELSNENRGLERTNTPDGRVARPASRPGNSYEGGGVPYVICAGAVPPMRRKSRSSCIVGAPARGRLDATNVRVFRRSSLTLLGRPDLSLAGFRRPLRVEMHGVVLAKGLKSLGNVANPGTIMCI